MSRVNSHVQGHQSCPGLSVLSVMAMVIRLSTMPATRSRKMGDEEEDNFLVNLCWTINILILIIIMTSAVKYIARYLADKGDHIALYEITTTATHTHTHTHTHRARECDAVEFNLKCV